MYTDVKLLSLLLWRRFPCIGLLSRFSDGDPVKVSRGFFTACLTENCWALSNTWYEGALFCVVTTTCNSGFFTSFPK